MATAGSSAAAAIAQAIKASGVIVSVDPVEFHTILTRMDSPLVIVAQERIFKSTFKYLTSYKGIAFYTKSREPLQIDSRCEIVSAKKIWIPG